ncbi:UNVERIFIED_CONTAM: hypothetical protein FKN15_065527 [Acipenser sinensis]
MVPRSPTCSVPNPLLNRDEVPALVPYCTHPGAKVTEPSQSTEADVVGVFTAQSVSMLRFFGKDRTAQWHVAGLNAGRVKNIMEWREKNGPFINHGQLKEVEDVGPTTFQQCAGFIRINPENLKSICSLQHRQRPHGTGHQPPSTVGLYGESCKEPDHAFPESLLGVYLDSGAMLATLLDGRVHRIATCLELFQLNRALMVVTL